MNPWVVVLFVLLLFGGGIGPWYPYSSGWGYGPSGGIGLIVLVIVVLLLLKKL